MRLRRSAVGGLSGLHCSTVEERMFAMATKGKGDSRIALTVFMGNVFLGKSGCYENRKNSCCSKFFLDKILAEYL